VSAPQASHGVGQQVQTLYWQVVGPTTVAHAEESSAVIDQTVARRAWKGTWQNCTPVMSASMPKPGAPPNGAAIAIHLRTRRA
jgi:hypothetical protein